MTIAAPHQTEEDPAVRAATSALSECDHARLPVWLVARIAVESARATIDAEVEGRMNDLRREVALLLAQRSSMATL